MRPFDCRKITPAHTYPNVWSNVATRSPLTQLGVKTLFTNEARVGLDEGRVLD